MLLLKGSGPAYRQVESALRDAILVGRFRPGDRLPATRLLATELSVSRNTVLRAFEQLLDQGYLVARVGSGTFVAATLPEERTATSDPRRVDTASSSKAAIAAPPPAAASLSRQGRRIVEAAPRGRLSWDMPRRNLPYDFRYGEPAYSDLPMETWCRLLGRRARRMSKQRLAYGEPQGALELRRALRGYLERSRGVACDEERVIVTHGSQQAVDLIARVLVDAGDRVAIEDPHYTGFAFVLRAHGAELVHVPVDEGGLRVDLLEDEPRVRLVCVTPSHQYPTGSVLSLDRRLALLDWSRRRDAFIVEDDYDGEYRYEGRPLPSLQGLDGGDRVVYVGTASKTLFPSLRIGWMVVPRPLVRPLTLAKAFSDTGGATLDQLVLADFIDGGHLERHVRRSRVRNASRRNALHVAVELHLGGRATLVGTRAGLHGLLRIERLPMEREAELRRRASAVGVGVYPAAPYYSSPPEHAEILLGFGSLTEAEIEEGVRRLAIVIEEMST